MTRKSTDCIFFVCLVGPMTLRFALILWILATETSTYAAPSITTWNELLAEPGVNQAGQDTYLNFFPIGNGDLTALVGVEDVGGSASITVLLTKQDAFDELANPFKVGLVEVGTALTIEQFTSLSLDPSVGTVTAVFGDVTVAAYVDMQTNVIVIESSTILSPKITNLRPEPIMSTGLFGDCDEQTVSSDVLVDEQTWYHRTNAASNYVKSTLMRLNLADIEGKFHDPIVNRTSGGKVFKISDNSLGIAAHTEQTDDVNGFLESLNNVVDGFKPTNKAASDNIWTEFWGRSYVKVTSSKSTEAETVSAITDQFATNRYLQRLQANTPYPIKFNGMAFTALRGENIDFRDWGGHNWWQNVRLQYYNMLASGDFDMIRTSLFEAYKNMIAYSRAKTLSYFPEYNTSSAVYFDEYTSLFGSTHTTSYAGEPDCSGRTDDMPNSHSVDVWNGMNWQSGLDLSIMMIDYYKHTGDLDYLKSCMPVIEGQLDFYYQQFGNDDDDEITIFPTQSIETYQCQVFPPDPEQCPSNDLPTIAGLRLLLSRIISLNSELNINSDILKRWTNFYSNLPAVPSNTETLLPCDPCNVGLSNVENPELYATHPYQIFTVGNSEFDSSVDLDKAIYAFENVKNSGDEGWNQISMDASLLGLTEIAKGLLSKRAIAESAPGYRFKSFMPHEFDYEPSADHMANFANSLVYMIVQGSESGGFVMFGAWPCEVRRGERSDLRSVAT